MSAIPETNIGDLLERFGASKPPTPDLSVGELMTRFGVSRAHEREPEPEEPEAASPTPERKIGPVERGLRIFTATLEKTVPGMIADIVMGGTPTEIPGA